MNLQSGSLALLTAAIWGGNPVAVSFSVDTLPPIAVAAVRFAMATVFMYFWCRWEGSGLRIRQGQLIPVLVAGIGLFVQITLFNVGVWLSNSSHGSMLIATFVFWVAVLEHTVTKADHLNQRKLLGLLLATIGVLLIFSVAKGGETAAAADAPSFWGDVVLLLSALVLAVKIVYLKHALKSVEPGKLVFWHDLVGVMLFLACSLTFERISPAGFTVSAVVALAYQGIMVAGLCFAIQALLLRRHSASQIAVFSFATPVCGVLLAVLLRGDSLSPWLAVSTACVAAGIWLVHAGPKRTITGPDLDP